MERELSLGRARLEAGQPALALAHFEDALRADPGSASPYLALGRTLLLLERASDAIPLLEAGRRRAPDDVPLLLALTDALRANGQARQALALLRAAVQRHTRAVDLQERRGETAQQLGAWSEAADAYSAVLDLARDDGGVSETQRARAEQVLRALAIVMSSSHPHAQRCSRTDTDTDTDTDTTDRTAEEQRWRRALSGC